VAGVLAEWLRTDRKFLRAGTGNSLLPRGGLKRGVTAEVETYLSGGGTVGAWRRKRGYFGYFIGSRKRTFM